MHDSIEKQPTAQMPLTAPNARKSQKVPRRYGVIVLAAILSLVVIILSTLIFVPLWQATQRPAMPTTQRDVDILVSSPVPPPFDSGANAILPTHRIIAFYGIPGAAPTGPAYELSSTMLKDLQQEGAAYSALDPAHPVDLGIDLVVSVPDPYPGPAGTYSHHVDSATIQSYIDFCRAHGLLLFLDLNFGQAPVAAEVNYFLPYLEKYSFVHMAIDPEWMFPQRNGVPGTDLSNVSAADLNTVIRLLAPIPMKYHVPRKILVIHQYRGDGDGLANTHDVSKVEIVDKRNILNDSRVDVVVHVDSVGNYPNGIRDKVKQYTEWVSDDMQRFHNFKYGGFKLFYNLEKKYGLMTPQQVLAMKPAPMIVTYGN